MSLAAGCNWPNSVSVGLGARLGCVGRGGRRGVVLDAEAVEEVLPLRSGEPGVLRGMTACANMGCVWSCSSRLVSSMWRAARSSEYSDEAGLAVRRSASAEGSSAKSPTMARGAMAGVDRPDADADAAAAVESSSAPERLRLGGTGLWALRGRLLFISSRRLRPLSDFRSVLPVAYEGEVEATTAGEGALSMPDAEVAGIEPVATRGEAAALAAENGLLLAAPARLCGVDADRAMGSKPPDGRAGVWGVRPAAAPGLPACVELFCSNAASAARKLMGSEWASRSCAIDAALLPLAMVVAVQRVRSSNQEWQAMLQQSGSMACAVSSVESSKE